MPPLSTLLFVLPFLIFAVVLASCDYWTSRRPTPKPTEASPAKPAKASEILQAA